LGIWPSGNPHFQKAQFLYEGVRCVCEFRFKKKKRKKKVLLKTSAILQKLIAT
jgi:hypothetical protein